MEARTSSPPPRTTPINDRLEEVGLATRSEDSFGQLVNTIPTHIHPLHHEWWPGTRRALLET
tara:strand:- start:793 stop:978 length:186 start_codon:yes stop_codon:yes gene_type:complete